ncbi:MAG: hypothetical protein GX211_04330 [Clostridiaceae bacterium]|jgi:hypothetical protein|nr:hypothetical protein [Clostridiaceae bacterium]
MKQKVCFVLIAVVLFIAAGCGETEKTDYDASSLSAAGIISIVEISFSGKMECIQIISKEIIGIPILLKKCLFI